MVLTIIHASLLKAEEEAVEAETYEEKPVVIKKEKLKQKQKKNKNDFNCRTWKSR